VQPTLIVGIGEWGAQVAAAFSRRVERRAGRLPIVRTVALAAGEGESGEAEPDLATALTAELKQTRRIEAVQAARRAGWRVEGKSGSSVVLVASLGEEAVGEAVLRVARSLRELSELDFACRLVLSGVFLTPREGETGLEEKLGFLRLLDGGCCLLNQVNADRLLVAAGQEQADLAACWLLLRVLTGLRTVLDRTPPNECDADTCFETFGLAAWEFPVGPLTARLARRWQREALERLLAPVGEDHRAIAPFLERISKVRPTWMNGAAVRFRVTGEAWARPALNLVRTLREALDRAVEAEYERLRKLAVRGERSLDGLEDDLRSALILESNSLLDGSGLGAAESFLAALEETAQSRSARLEREANRCSARAQELDEEAEEAGQSLDDLTARFPPCRLRTMLGLFVRPWRLLHLWLLYREIAQRSGLYLSYRQSQWLLQTEAIERQRQAAFYARLAETVEVERQSVARLRTRLKRLCDSLSSDPALDRALARQLEEAALPPELADYFYRRVAGSQGANPVALLAVYGPLSRWVREDWTAERVELTLAEHAQELFAFLTQVRLDELLARTYSGTELRSRLAALVDASAPWWACDESKLNAGERARLNRPVMIGLPDGVNSFLTDLLPNRPFSCFSTGDRHQVVAAQVIQGLRVGG